MSERPDIAAKLAPGEALLWQGQPEPGRRVPLRATVYASVLGGLTAVLLLASWFVAVWHATMPNARIIVLGLIVAAALATFFALRLTLLDRRRARARDKRTAYAITDRRALVLAGPYLTEVALGPETEVKRLGDTLRISRGETSLRFERLSDARAAQSLLTARLEGET